MARHGVGGGGPVTTEVQADGTVAARHRGKRRGPCVGGRRPRVGVMAAGAQVGSTPTRERWRQEHIRRDDDDSVHGQTVALQHMTGGSCRER
jgi:hypothetical protein